MRNRRLFAVLIALLLCSCQLFAAPPAAPAGVPTNLPAPGVPTATVEAVTTATATAAPSKAAPAPTAQAAKPAQAEGAALDFTTRAGLPSTLVQLKVAEVGAYQAGLDALPLNLAGLANPSVISGLTGEQKQFLVTNGFVVLSTGEKQFKEIRQPVSKVNGQPYYLTTDAAYHALHVTFNDLLEALEGRYFRPMLARLTQALYQQVGAYAAGVQGQPVEEDAQLAQAYLAVALKLLDPTAALDAPMDAKIAPQIAQILAYAGKAPSALIPGFQDDYGAYRPVGHYAGKPALESYFHAMTWFGRVAFKFKDAENPQLKPSRAPLLITLALREASFDGLPAYKVWTSLYEVTDFMVGPSDDPGPVELNALMEQVYGPAPTLAGLADEAKWQEFLAAADGLPAPRINSTFASFSSAQAAERDWRFMGQRFTPDGFIFQSLIYDKVGTRDNPRKFPSGLDVAAAFGSPAALQALETAGETQYANYPAQLAAVQQMITAQPEDQWLNRFYTTWLYAFRPQAAAKKGTFPPYMRTQAWGYKEVNSLLGSWAELKHDTVLYAKMPEGLGGGGPPTSGPAPAYVEPNPGVFYRLAYAASVLSANLTPQEEDWNNRGWAVVSPGEDSYYNQAHQYLLHLTLLAERFTQLGDIAARELAGQPLSADDYGLIQECLEYKECLDHGAYSRGAPEPDPIPVIAAVSGWENDVLEAAVGDLSRIYVAVPLEGTLQIAQGGVFTYYEFTQPRSDRLTDQAWRDRLQNNPPAAPAWAKAFQLPGGKPAYSLAFRVGDVYIITEKGGTPPLNLRAGPSKADPVVKKLEQGTYLTILAGPVKNADGTWWKVQVESGQGEPGWVLENAEWYVRSYN
jgi:hypothetical protein